VGVSGVRARVDAGDGRLLIDEAIDFGPTQFSLDTPLHPADLSHDGSTLARRQAFGIQS
jgi:hypothetical protein